MIYITQSDNRPVAEHMYLFTDGSPEDRLANGMEERWHTQAFFTFDMTEGTQDTFQNDLRSDPKFNQFISKFGTLRKWSGSSHRYKRRFVETLQTITESVNFNAVSFQEKTLRRSKEKLLKNFNKSMSGRDISFEQIGPPEKLNLRHTFVNLTGLHIIEKSENQMLVLLLIARGIADQYSFYYRMAKKEGFARLKMSVVSDRLAGDGDTIEVAKRCLNFFIDPGLFYHDQSHEQISLMRSAVGDTFEGDLIVDNYAGLLNGIAKNPGDELSKNVLAHPPKCLLNGWKRLSDLSEQLDFVPFIGTLS